jgi:hypothetical protein
MSPQLPEAIEAVEKKVWSCAKRHHKDALLQRSLVKAKADRWLRPASHRIWDYLENFDRTVLPDELASFGGERG